ncbi:TPA: hypothetical protein DCX16_00105, partial [bacterium]|nr:hypothetical protein [bacterium]
MKTKFSFFILFFALSKCVEGRMPIFSSSPSTLTSQTLQVGTKGTEWLPAPIIYDLDNDGKKDLLVGDKDGHIHFYRNQSPSFPPFSEYILLKYLSDPEDIEIDVGDEAKPHIADWNKDEFPDLLVGCKEGTIFLFLGTSTTDPPYISFLPPKKLESGLRYITTFGKNGVVNNVFISGCYAYVCQGLEGLSIYDIADINNPVLLGSYKPPSGFVNDVFVDGEYAYIANGCAGIFVLNISDPKSPAPVGGGIYKSQCTGDAKKLTVVDGWAYIANGNKGLWVVNMGSVTDYLKTPQPVSENFYTDSDITNRGDCSFVKYVDGYIFLSTGMQSIYCFSVDTSEELPSIDHKWTTNGPSGSNIRGFDIFDGKYLCAAAGIPGVIYFERSGNDWTNSPDYHGILYDTLGYAYNLAVSQAGSYTFISDGVNGMRVLKLGIPVPAEDTGIYDTPGEVVNISLYGNYALISDRKEGVFVADISGYFLENKDIDVGASSAPFFSDFDEDGARDLLVGDSFGRILFFKNLGCDDNPYFNRVGENIIVDSITLDVGENAVPYFIDWDGDGIKDFIVGDNLGYIWFFKGNPEIATKTFQAGKKVKAGNRDIDVGFRAVPFVCDFDGNGGYDLIVGEAGGTIDIFLNTKNTFAEPPNFNISYKMPGDQSDINEGENPSIFVCDFDGNKKYDLIIGSQKGEIYFYRNIGDATPILNGGIALWMATETTTYTLDVGHDATPFIYDLDGDGKKDIISGNREGYVLFYRNIGSDDAPLFESPIYLTLKDVPIDAGFNSAPILLDWDDDGRIDFLVGNREGNILFFAGEGGLSFKEGVPLSVPSGILKTGRNAKPLSLDINGDGMFDLLVGSDDGGFLFLNNGSAGSPTLTEGVKIFDGISFAYSDFTGDFRKDIIAGQKQGYILLYECLEEVDLSLTIKADKNKIFIHDEVTYTLEVKNNGDRDANNVLVKVRVPHKAVYIRGGDYCSQTREISFSLTSLSSLGEESFSFVLGLKSDYSYSYLTIIAHVSSDEETIPISSNIISIPIVLLPSLSLKKEVSQAFVEPGGSLTYTITYSIAHEDANYIIIEDEIPNSLIYITGSAEGDGMDILYDHNGEWDRFDYPPVSKIRWTRGKFGSGTIGTVSFKVLVNGSVDDKTIIENKVEAEVDTDFGTLTQTSTIDFIVSSKPVFVLKKEASPSIITFGDTLIYTINYELLCKDAEDIELVDSIPKGLTLIDVQSDDPVAYSHDGGITYDEFFYHPITHVKIRKQSLVKDSRGTLVIETKLTDELDDRTTITNIARISSKEGEIETATTQVLVRNIPQLEGSTSVFPSGPISTSWLLKYFINYQNIGQTSAKDVVIKCDADKNPYLKDITPLNGGKIEPTSIVWNIGTVPTGASGSVSFTAYVASNFTLPVEIVVNAWIIAQGDVYSTLTLSSEVFESFDSFCNAWSMFGNNPAHSHYAQDEILAPPLRYERTIDFDGGIFSSPAVTEDGIVYIATDRGEIKAIDIDGNSIWKKEISDSFWSSPAIAGTDTLYIYIGGRNLPVYFYCFDAKTGDLYWKYKTGSHIYTSPVVKYGIVYFGDDNGRIYALRGTDGEPIWTYDTGHQEVCQLSSPAVENGLLYIGSKDKSIYCLDAFTGNLIWVYRTDGRIASSPAFADGNVYVGSDDGYLYCLRTGTQASLLWKYNIGSPIQSSPAIAYRKVYFGADDGKVYALSKEGSLTWSYQTQGKVFSSPAIANHVVYIGSDDGWLYCLDAEDGRLIAKYYIGGGIRASPSIERKKVFIGSIHSKFYFFVESPEILVKKSPSISKVSPGGTVTWTISYKNNSYVPATDVSIIDILDGNFGEPVNIKVSKGSVDTNLHEIVWDLREVSGKEEGSLQFDVVVNQNVDVSTITNRVIFESNEAKFEIEPVDISLLIPILSFRKTVDRKIANPLSTLTYTLVCTNIGNSDATNLVIEDILSEISTCTYIQGSVHGDGDVEYKHEDDIWDKIDYLPVHGIRWFIPKLVAGGSWTGGFMVFVGRIDDGTMITNTGNASSDECETITSSCSTYITSKSMLSITKRGPKKINPGEPLTYNISYTSLYADTE